MQRYTVRHFNKQFPDDDTCLEYIKNSRWPSGITCERCNKVTQHYRIRTKKVYSCDMCGTQVSPTAGTIFHKSRTSLRDWFYAIFLMASTRTGISAKHLERELGVTYKTAWRMFNQIRKLMEEDVDPLSGHVESDETYVGGKRRGMGRGYKANKAVVHGMVQRKGSIIAEVVPNAKAATLMPNITKKVLPATTVFTDELRSYDGLGTAGFTHERVNHSAEVWVSGTAHTNTIEGFWSLVKRGIDGANHMVNHKYLQTYLDSYTYRWNHRDDEQPMFVSLLNRIPSWADGTAGMPS